jgi:hypothetical protein
MSNDASNNERGDQNPNPWVKAPEQLADEVWKRLVAGGVLAIKRNRKGRPIYRNGEIAYKITEKGIKLYDEVEAFCREYTQPKGDRENVNVQFMQFLSVDQLARYNDALETIDKFASGLDPTHFTVEVLGRSQGPLVKAVLTNAEIRDVLARLGRAWKKLEPLACQAIENLVGEGLIPTTRGANYFLLVYLHIMQQEGGSIKSDEDFQGVSILQFLKRLLVGRLPEFAIEYRERGQPMVAQAMEELAEFEDND